MFIINKKCKHLKVITINIQERYYSNLGNQEMFRLSRICSSQLRDYKYEVKKCLNELNKMLNINFEKILQKSSLSIYV